MCYMAVTKIASAATPERRPRARERLGVRELRQNLSVYLARVIEGERFDVTDRGHIVAMLVPAPRSETLVERLISDGRAIPPTRDAVASRASAPVKITAAQRRRIWEALETTRGERL